MDCILGYRDALLESGYAPNSTSRPLDITGKTNSREAYETFAHLKVAPDALAVMSLFSEVAGLSEQEDFSV